MRNNKANPLYNSNWYNFMEGDHTVFIFGITCASIIIGVYVFFGSNLVHRKKTPVLGLQNLGQTCFMNTILQALGSCPMFIKWLNSQSQSLGEVGHALRNILLRLGQVAPQSSSEYFIQPLEFMSVLSQHGWQMNLYNNIQQDAHELMTFILSKIEDEIFLNIKNQRNGLSWLDRERNVGEDGTAGTSPSLFHSSDSHNAGSEDTVRRETLLKKRRTLGLHNTNMQTHCATPFRGRLVSQIRCAVCGHENPLKFDNFDSLSLHLPLTVNIGQSHTLEGLLKEFVNTEIINEFECDMCNKVSIGAAHTSGDTSSVISPFHNSMDTSSRNPEINDIGNRVNSPEINIMDRVSGMVGDFNRTAESGADFSRSSQSELGNIGGELVAPGIPSESLTHRIPGDMAVPDISSRVASTDCGIGIPVVTPRRKVLCDAVRTLRIGKLPPCLCFHIHRTCYSSSGAYKRADYVHFSEYLLMDPYTYNSTLREREVKKQLVTRLNGTLPHDFNGVDSSRWARTSNLYRLKAVVVHKGSAEDGHFVTYRRGPLDSLLRNRSLPSSTSETERFEDRWYYTSDADIRESSLAEALKSAAYMLFYEKCSSALIANEINNLTEALEMGVASSARLTNGHCIT